MRIELAYGRTGAAVEVPDKNLVAVVQPDWPAVLARPEAAVAVEPVGPRAMRRIRRRPPVGIGAIRRRRQH